MVLNDFLLKQSVFFNIAIKDGNKELPKELKVKIMRIRIAYNKIKKNFDSEVKEFTEELLTNEFKTLRDKKEKTPEEIQQLTDLTKQIELEYSEFLNQKGNEEIAFVDDVLTEEEFAEIVEVNAGNDVEINKQAIPALNFLEIVHDFFVKEC